MGVNVFVIEVCVEFGGDLGFLVWVEEDFVGFRYLEVLLFFAVFGKGVGHEDFGFWVGLSHEEVSMVGDLDGSMYK